MRSTSLNTPPEADYFLPALQRPETFTNIVVRTIVPTADMTAAFGSASRFLRLLLQSAVLAIGAWLVINQQATAGVMLAAADQRLGGSLLRDAETADPPGWSIRRSHGDRH